jgi:hypothetical protein
MRNTRLTLLFLLLLAGFTLPSRSFAQNGLYVAYSGAALHNSGGQPNQYGPMVGLYLNNSYGKVVSAGVDFRASFLSGSNNTSLDTGLVGFRLAIRPRVLPISPYGQLMIGVASSTLASKSNTDFAAAALVGVDYTLVPPVDWRVLELSYSRVNAVNPFNPVSLSTGIVLRFR